jgi:phospholipid-binding lipoprotein MlaA
MIEARPEASLPEESEETAPDPLEPLNRLSFLFKEKRYFWVLKPLATGYKSILPLARSAIDGAFLPFKSNIALVF